MKIISFVSVIFASICLIRESSGGFRCGYIGEWWCKATCLALGHDSGYCDLDETCNCSEEDLDIKKEVEDVFGDLDIAKTVREKVNEFTQYVDSWEIDETLKSAIPSRCRIGSEFCRNTCRSIGREDGTCNEDNSDCDCADDVVGARQWALCVDNSICRLDCQRKKYARGECTGPKEWDCKCISNKGAEVPNTQEEGEDYENFDEPSNTDNRTANHDDNLEE